MITTTTPLPTILWLNLIQRNGKVFLSKQTFDETGTFELYRFLTKHDLIVAECNDGYVIKPA